MTLLQVLNNYKELVALCTQILHCVENTDPSLVVLLQQEVFQLRWRLAEISIQADSLRRRIVGLTERL